MCLDRQALNALAAVTHGRVYRKRSPAPRPLRGGKPIESERMFGPDSLFERAFRAQAGSAPPSVDVSEDEQSSRVEHGPEGIEADVDDSTH